MAKVVITGANGQLGWELQQTAPSDHILFPLSRQELDITSAQDVADTLARIQPDYIINAAAYTAVDNAEKEPDQAKAINVDAVKYLAEYCRNSGAQLIQISTDFVFDGSQNTPIGTDAVAAPLSVYGQTKYDAEQMLISEFSDVKHAIIRTAWVYSTHGNNFVKSMLRLMAEKPQLGIVSDQIGTPTWAKGLAELCWQAIDKQITGVYHWTDAGVASWYDFAVAIQNIAVELGMLDKKTPISAIKATAYPTPATRPAFSYLDKTKTIDTFALEQHTHWQDQLKQMLKELKREKNV